MKKNYLSSVIALFLSTIFWGTAGVIMKLTLDEITPYYLLAFRFSVAAIVLLAVYVKRLKHITKRTLKTGSLMGIVMYFEFLLFTWGLNYTTATKSAFIIGAYVILVPIAYLICHRRFPNKSSLVGAFICLIGVCFVLFDDFSGINKGDIITMVSSLCYAFHIVMTAKYVKDEDPVQLNVIQISVAALLAIIAAFCMESVPAKIGAKECASIVYLGVVCTVLPYLLSVYGQKYVQTTTAAIILSFECVVGCLTAVLVLGEAFSFRIGMGAVLIIGSLVVAEIDWRKYGRRVHCEAEVE